MPRTDAGAAGASGPPCGHGRLSALGAPAAHPPASTHGRGHLALHGAAPHGTRAPYPWNRATSARRSVAKTRSTASAYSSTRRTFLTARWTESGSAKENRA